MQKASKWVAEILVVRAHQEQGVALLVEALKTCGGQSVEPTKNGLLMAAEGLTSQVEEADPRARLPLQRLQQAAGVLTEVAPGCEAAVLSVRADLGAALKSLEMAHEALHGVPYLSKPFLEILAIFSGCVRLALTVLTAARKNCQTRRGCAS